MGVVCPPGCRGSGTAVPLRSSAQFMAPPHTPARWGTPGTSFRRTLPAILRAPTSSRSQSLLGLARSGSAGGDGTVALESLPCSSCSHPRPRVCFPDVYGFDYVCVLPRCLQVCLCIPISLGFSFLPQPPLVPVHREPPLRQPLLGALPSSLPLPDAAPPHPPITPPPPTDQEAAPQGVWLLWSHRGIMGFLIFGLDSERGCGPAGGGGCTHAHVAALAAAQTSQLPAAGLLLPASPPPCPTWQPPARSLPHPWPLLDLGDLVSNPSSAPH